MLLKSIPEPRIPEQVHANAASPFLSGCCRGEHTWKPFGAVLTYCPLRTEPVFLAQACGTLISTQIRKGWAQGRSVAKGLILSWLRKLGVSEKMKEVKRTGAKCASPPCWLL